MSLDKKQYLIGRLSLLTLTLIWGSSFSVLKLALNNTPTLYVMAFRFTGAALLMLILGFREMRSFTKRQFLMGALMGLCYFLAFFLQSSGLARTTAGKNAFLTATYCVTVPFLFWLIKKRRPDRFNVLAAVICIVGVGFISMQNDFSIGLGEAITFAGSFFYALHIIVTAEVAKGENALMATTIQFFVMAILSWFFALTTIPFPETIPSQTVFAIFYLCIMGTAVAFLLQLVGQRYTPPTPAAVIMSLESVFGTVISIIIYHDALSVKLVCGFVCVFAAILISELKPRFLLFGRKDKEAEQSESEPALK